MAVTLITLCTSSVPNGCSIIFIGQGLSAGTTYGLYIEDISDPLNDFLITSGAADVNGNVVFQITTASQSNTYWLHPPGGGAIGNRIGNSTGGTWSGSGSCFSWTPSAPVLSANLVGTSVDLSWTPSVVCDPTIGQVTYTIKRGLTSPPTTTNVVTGYTGTTYTDGPLTVGLTYYYRVIGEWDFSPTYGGFGGLANSNIVSVSPVVGVRVAMNIRVPLH